MHWEHILEALECSLKDTGMMIPWILGMYIIIELIENKVDLKKVKRLGGRLGPLVGSAMGLIPQCGFSVMTAKFYEQKYITLGTLFAVFMATSDEALIIMLTHGNGKSAVWALPMIAVKVLVGVAVGYSVDGILRLFGKKQKPMPMIEISNGAPTTTHDIFMQQYLQEKEVEVNCSCGRTHTGNNPWKNYLLYPLLHALKVAAFILLVNFVLELIIHGVGGEDVFKNWMQGNRYLQPIFACLVGLIPNCASSVVLTQTFLEGGITFGSCVAGLCANAGMGFVVLLKNARKWKRNLAIVGVCYLLSVCVGMLVNLVTSLAGLGI